MATEKEKSLERIKTVAENLGQFLDKVVFLGGATVGLLITDKGAPDVRHTTDVDVIIGVKSVREYHALGEQLRALGFANRIMDGFICSWWIGDVRVDVMPISKEILGFSNRWYEHVFVTAVNMEIASGLVIRLIDPPCFLATKFEAHNQRGQGDYLLSKDIADVISVVNGREEIVAEMKSAPEAVRGFVAKQTKKFLKSGRAVEDIQGFLRSDLESQGRFRIIEARLKEISGYAK
jgi:hypothetical protein